MRAVRRTDWTVGGSATAHWTGEYAQGRGDWEERVRGIREAARVTEVAAGSERVAASRCLLSVCVLQSRDCKIPHSFSSEKDS